MKCSCPATLESSKILGFWSTFHPLTSGSLMHTVPYLNYTPITSSSNRFTLSNLNDLNTYGDHVYLTSDDVIGV